MAVPVDEGGGSALVDLEPPANGILGVVGTLGQWPFANIAGAGHFGRVVDEVVGGAALGAYPPTRHALEHFFVVGLQVDHDVDAPGAGHFRQRLSLSHGAREAVEDEPGGRARPEQVLPDHAHDNVVGHQLAPVHVRLEATPELGAAGGGGTESVARRDVGRPVDSRQAGRLGPLAGPLAPEDHHAKSGVGRRLSHYRRNPS